MNLRSPAAIIAGYFVIGVVELLLLPALLRSGQTYSAAALASAAFAALPGGYATARIGKRHRAIHALGLLLFAAFIAAVSALGSYSADSLAFQLAQVGAMVPGILLGTAVQPRAGSTSS